MKAHLVIFMVCCLAGAYSKCPLRSPVGKIADGCKVVNLTVTVYQSQTPYSREIINQMLCNSTADASLFNYVPQNVRFQRMSHAAAPGVTYLLTAVDLTAKKLIWMVSNLTVSYDLSVFPTGNRYNQTILPFHKPEFNQGPRQHVVEFHIFEEYRNHPKNSYLPNNAIYTTPFNLSYWIESQQNSGITLCGPVAGGSVVAFQQYPDPAPAPGPGPQPQPKPANPTKSPHSKGNNGNRIVVDGMVLAGVVIFSRVLGF